MQARQVIRVRMDNSMKNYVLPAFPMCIKCGKTALKKNVNGTQVVGYCECGCGAFQVVWFGHEPMGMN